MEDLKDINPDEVINQTGEVPAEITPPTSRERALKHLSTRNPDKQYGEEDDLMEDLLSAMEEDSEHLGKSRTISQKFNDIFEAEPVVYQIISDIVQGAPGMVAIARNVTHEDLDAALSDPSNEDWDKNLGSRQQRLDSQRQADSDAEKAIDESMAEALDFAKENDMTEQETVEFLADVDEKLADLYRGKVTKAFLQRMFDSLDYKTKLDEQKKLGEIAGRNQKIVTEKEVATDNLPKITSGASAVTQSEPTKEGYIDKLNKRKG